MDIKGVAYDATDREYKYCALETGHTAAYYLLDDASVMAPKAAVGHKIKIKLAANTSITVTVRKVTIDRVRKNFEYVFDLGEPSHKWFSGSEMEELLSKEAEEEDEFAF